MNAEHAPNAHPDPGDGTGYETRDASVSALLEVRGRPDRLLVVVAVRDARDLSSCSMAERPEAIQATDDDEPLPAVAGPASTTRRRSSRATAGSIARRASSGSRSTGPSSWWPKGGRVRQGPEVRARDEQPRGYDRPRRREGDRQGPDSPEPYGIEAMKTRMSGPFALVLLTATWPATVAARSLRRRPARRRTWRRG